MVSKLVSWARGSSGRQRVGRVPGAMQDRWARVFACFVLAVAVCALTAAVGLAAEPHKAGDPDAGAVRRGPTPGVAKAAAAATGPGCDAGLPVVAHHPGGAAA